MLLDQEGLIVAVLYQQLYYQQRTKQVLSCMETTLVTHLYCPALNKSSLKGQNSFENALLLGFAKSNQHLKTGNTVVVT